MSQAYAEIIGDPVGHSKSPLIHKFWLDKLGIEADYRACHVTPDGLQTYIESRRDDADWRGCNVTIPHKVTVMDLVDDPGGVRDTIGAMNTIIRDKGGMLTGTNTDAAGFFMPISGLDLSGEPSVVIGAGGAARAILFTLAKIGAGPVTVLNRSPLKAGALLARFGLSGEALPLDSHLPPARLLVNTSALGMTGQPPLDIDLSPLPEDAVVYDIVYHPLETPLLADARARGLMVVDGLEMLIGQAAIAFEMFFGSPPPEDCEDELRELLLR